MRSGGGGSGRQPGPNQPGASGPDKARIPGAGAPWAGGSGGAGERNRQEAIICRSIAPILCCSPLPSGSLFWVMSCLPKARSHSLPFSWSLDTVCWSHWRSSIGHGVAASPREELHPGVRPLTRNPGANSSAGQSACLTSKRSQVRALFRPHPATLPAPIRGKAGLGAVFRLDNGPPSTPMAVDRAGRPG